MKAVSFTYGFQLDPIAPLVTSIIIRTMMALCKPGQNRRGYLHSGGVLEQGVSFKRSV